MTENPHLAPGTPEGEDYRRRLAELQIFTDKDLGVSDITLTRPVTPADQEWIDALRATADEDTA